VDVVDYVVGVDDGRVRQGEQLDNARCGAGRDVGRGVVIWQLAGGDLGCARCERPGIAVAYCR